MRLIKLASSAYAPNFSSLKAISSVASDTVLRDWALSESVLNPSLPSFIQGSCNIQSQQNAQQVVAALSSLEIYCEFWCLIYIKNMALRIIIMTKVCKDVLVFGQVIIVHELVLSDVHMRLILAVHP